MAKRLSDEEWQPIRKEVLKRDGHQCVRCKAGESLHVHHLMPKEAGGKDELDNLICLCSACHSVAHMNMQVSLARKFIERWAIKLARWLDKMNQIPKKNFRFTPVLKLLGKSSFRPGQLEVIFAALRGESILFVSPTGSGKSLCFQVPTLLREGFSLVVAPLKTLMKDQVQGLHSNMIPASYINSDIGKDEKELRYQLLEQKAFKLLYCAPERFGQLVKPEELSRLRKLKPTFLVIDEAHVISKWGKGFRPDYSRLAYIRKMVGDPPVLAFTATATKETQQGVLRSLNIPDAKVFVRDVDRKNISLVKISESSFTNKIRFIANLIESLPDKKMIFVPTRKIGKEVQEGLESIGMNIPFFHSRLSTNEKDFIQARFAGSNQPELNTVICTNAFGMGIDIPNIRAVVHWQHPASIEDYVQEFGRAGRDGRPSIALLFASKNDYGLQEYMINRNLENTNFKGTIEVQKVNYYQERSYQIKRLQEMSEYANQKGICLRKAIKAYFQDEPENEERTPWSLRLLNFIFSRKGIKARKSFCCSVCKKPWGKWLDFMLLLKN